MFNGKTDVGMGVSPSVKEEVRTVISNFSELLHCLMVKLMLGWDDGSIIGPSDFVLCLGWVFSYVIILHLQEVNYWD